MKSIRKNFLKPFLFVCFGLMIATFAVGNPFDEPGKPGSPEVVDAGAGQCELRYTAPVSDGGSPIINYIIEVKEKYESRWRILMKVSGPVPEVLMLTMDEGKTVQFRVIAVNAAGPGEPSEPTDVISF